MLSKLFILAMALVLAGCQVTPADDEEEILPRTYEQVPVSILILPANNQTTAADATVLYSTSLAAPLSEAGYYVMSVPYTNTFMQMEGITDGAQINKSSLSRFRDIFDADFVLYVTLKNWDSNYYIVSSNVKVAVELTLMSTDTQEVLWTFDDVISQGSSSSGLTSYNNPAFMLIDVISAGFTAINTDYISLSNRVNQRIINTMPRGKYHPDYNPETDLDAEAPFETQAE